VVRLSEKKAAAVRLFFVLWGLWSYPREGPLRELKGMARRGVASQLTARFEGPLLF
jgi:hypothetical protein